MMIEKKKRMELNEIANILLTELERKNIIKGRAEIRTRNLKEVD